MLGNGIAGSARLCIAFRSASVWMKGQHLVFCRLQEEQVQESDRQAGKKAGKKAGSSAQPDSKPVTGSASAAAEGATAAASPAPSAHAGAQEAAKKDQDGDVAMQDAGAGPSSSDVAQHAGKLTGRLH